MTSTDPAATRALLEHSGWLRGLARRLLRDEQRAEDAVQDTLTTALQTAPREGAGRGWLATVLLNRVRQEERGRLRRAARELAATPRGSAPAAADTAARLELQRRVVDAVQALAEPYRTAIVLRFLDGLPPREVARRTNAPVKTVHTRLERGLAQLRVRLDSEYGRRETWALLMLPLAVPRLLSGPAAAASGVALMSTQVKLGAAVTAAAVVGLVAWQMHRSPSLEPEVRSAAPPAEIVRELAPTTPAVRPNAAAETRASVAAVEPVQAPVPSSAAPAEAIEMFVGRVVDEHAAPVAGLVVSFRPTSHPDEPLRVEPEPIVSAPDGTFHMAVVAERGVLTASGRGYASVVEPGLQGGAPPPEPPVIVVAPSETYAGVVVDPEGRPLAGAELAIELSRERAFELTGQRFAPPLRRALADADGRFRFEDVGALRGLELAAQHAGHVGTRIELPLASVFDMRIELAPLATIAATVTGRVVDAVETAVADAFVSLGEHTARSDAAGGFTLELPQAGAPALLRAVQPGFLPAQRALERGKDGTLVDPAPIVMVLGGEALTIAGRVLDAAGEPLAGARVWTPDGTPFGFMIQRFGELDFYVDVDVEELIAGGAARADARQSQTDADGEFELRGLADASYALFALHPRTQELARLAAVRGGSHDVVLRIVGSERTAVVAGRVVSYSGAPIAGATLEPQRRIPRGDGNSVLCTAGSEARVTTDAEGRFRFESLATEQTVLLLGGEPIATPRTTELAGEADLEHLEIRAPAKCHLRIVLSDPELADSLELLDASGESLQLTITAGSVTLAANATGLQNGRSDLIQTDESARTLVLHKAGSEVLRVALELRPGEVNEIRP